MVNHNQKPILLLRGLIRECRHWGDFPQRLECSFPNREIITLDIPGNGLLYRQSSPDSIAGMTDNLRSQLTTRNSKPGLHILALSMGGMVAIEWMTRFPKEIASAVLINTSIRPHSPFYHRLYWRNYLTILRLCISSSTQREKIVLLLTSNHYQNDAFLLRTWQDWQKQCPVAASNALRQLTAAMNFSAPIRPTQSLLFIKSQKDRLVFPACSEKIAHAWQAPCIEHATAGHDLPLDDPEWLLDQMCAWLKCR